MSYRRILTIQDISCVGQCSMTVALPILSACGHEVCILPAAVLSTHTGGFGKPVVRNLTDMFEQTIRHWQENQITFDQIYTGYLGSVEAIGYARKIMETMLAPGGLTIVDPAMADHGKRYSGLDEAYAREMIDLCAVADIVIPNITEAAMISGMDVPKALDENAVEALLNGLGKADVVLTGVGFREDQTGAAVRAGGQIHYVHHEKVGGNFHGTGDMYAAALVGALASGKELVEAARIAGEFTKTSIENTCREPAHWYGVKFETALPNLIELLK